jgi:putative flippase GtrA
MGSRQIVRFAVVGLVSNALLFGLYLLLTNAGLSYVPAMTAVYAIGIAQTFVANRSWTFGHADRLGSPFVRYVVTYALGYLLNLALLTTLVGGLHLPHAWVQGALIFVVAAFVFVLQKHWVFRVAAPAPRRVAEPRQSPPSRRA